MSDVVIRAEGLGKKYLIGHQSAGRERYTALRDVVGRQVQDLVRSGRDMLQGRQIVAGDEVEEFWALKDVSFEIKRGDVVGIIGRNGAGKSTLLKVLSRITEPSTGQVEVKGCVASLLEVGTGFHPELSGRENIYLNGSILGMTRAEIKKRFDEIVAFAEVEKFLDTPVKRYSSGMYVRLAFAVAAHLEPELLVVDEVLAVGDAEFQKKCLGKMQDVASHGRTVLFVSHNMAAIERLCSISMLFSQGMLAFLGPNREALARYQENFQVDRRPLALRRDRGGDGRLRFREISINGSLDGNVDCGGDIVIDLAYSASEEISRFNVSVHICDNNDQVVFRTSTIENHSPFRTSRGDGTVRCKLPKLPIVPGHYTLTVAASRPPMIEHLDFVTRAAELIVNERDIFGTGKIPPLGYFYHPTEWIHDMADHSSGTTT